MNSREDKIFELYTLIELNYKEHFKNLVEDINDLFPEGWYEKKDYHKKIEILAESIKQNQLIINTSKYQDFINIDKKYIKE